LRSPVVLMVVGYPPTVAGAAAELPDQVSNYGRRTAFPWLALAGTPETNVASGRDCVNL
jgi:hypothetical protein